MKLAVLAATMAIVALMPATVLAHPHIIVSQSVRAIESNGAYTHVEIVWTFDPHASEDEIPAIDEDKDGKFSEEEIGLLIRDTMPGFQKVGFLTWLNTGSADFNPTKLPDFTARIDDPASFTPPNWDHTAGDGEKMPANKQATLPIERDPHSPRNLVYTMRFELPKPVKSFTITTYDPEDYMRVVVDKESLSKGCTLDKHPMRKSEFVPGYPVFADRVSCRLP